MADQLAKMEYASPFIGPESFSQKEEAYNIQHITHVISGRRTLE